jgi:hypothetical protein
MGDQATKWDLFRRTLIGSGVQLQDRSDGLKWIGGDNSGTLTVKNVCCTLDSKLWHQSIGGWQKKLWNWDCALKTKKIIWLSVENKILTWDNLQRKGWFGPSICLLCLNKPETIKHLLVNCSFTKQVWSRIKRALNLTFVWEGYRLNDFFESWNKHDSMYPSLPAIIS